MPNVPSLVFDKRGHSSRDKSSAATVCQSSRWTRTEHVDEYFLRILSLRNVRFEGLYRPIGPPSGLEWAEMLRERGEFDPERQASRVVYVDSGSSDGGVEFARSIGAKVMKLDPNLPFTAARARSSGIERLAA